MQCDYDYFVLQVRAFCFQKLPFSCLTIAFLLDLPNLFCHSLNFYAFYKRLTADSALIEVSYQLR